jgi:hypothetical protein
VNEMTVSDLYKVIDDDTPFNINFCIGNMLGCLCGDDWNNINQDILDMTIKNIWYSKYFNRLMIVCRDLPEHYSKNF